LPDDEPRSEPTIAADAAASKVPLVTFHRFVSNARLPQRADRSAAGSMPTRAFRYCEAMVSAAAFGWYIFPPIGFSLLWDGTDVRWTWDGVEGWHPLSVAQFPGFAAQFDEAAPEDTRGFSPPFIGAMQEPGLIQFWSGIVARTAPGWSLLVRAPANLPRKSGYELYEGIVETDRWFGPLFAALRLTRTDTPIAFRPDQPIFQVQPLPRHVYAEQTLNNYELVPDLSGLRPDDWDDYYETVVRPNVQTNRPRGAYAAATRKRRKGEPETLA
jgi:hypothetical protein